MGTRNVEMGCGASATALPDQPQMEATVHTNGSGASSALPGELKVWLGFVKLDEKFPSREALTTLLYNSEAGSAEGCDIIALNLTDLILTKKTVPPTRHLLKNVLRNADDYVL